MGEEVSCREAAPMPIKSQRFKLLDSQTRSQTISQTYMEGKLD